MTFRVGQKVVRFASSEGDFSEFCRRHGLKSNDYSAPDLGEIVTIKTINHWPAHTLLTFCEHDNSALQRKLQCRWEPGFDASRFRPIVERKTDISFAHEILKKASKKQGADA